MASSLAKLVSNWKSSCASWCSLDEKRGDLKELADDDDDAGYGTGADRASIILSGRSDERCFSGVLRATEGSLCLVRME